jgi:hypothetical protein
MRETRFQAFAFKFVLERYAAECPYAQRSWSKADLWWTWKSCDTPEAGGGGEVESSCSPV